MEPRPPKPQQLLDFTGKTVIVTGAGSGMGTGIARRFAEAGASVVASYFTSEAGARQLVEEIKAAGGKAMAVRADVSSASDAERLVTEAVGAFGGVHVLVNNAGTYPLAPLLQMSEAQFDQVVAANLRSVHVCTQAAARQMVAQGGGGAIVNISTIEAENPAPLHSHYSAAKAGVAMYTRSAALELGAKDIRVNCVSPGLIWREGLDEEWPDGVTRYQRAVPLGRLGRAEDVADACLFLASPGARWITGANLLVDGGVMCHTIY